MTSAHRAPGQYSPHCVGIIIVVEVDPDSFRAAGFDPVRPLRQLTFRIVMPIPAPGTMQANADFLRRPDKVIW
jgi:hypothetical protein